jgi:16S rRNA (adenine1518-N6/adenine1519-N6)-dimethyltransferase
VGGTEDRPRAPVGAKEVGAALRGLGLHPRRRHGQHFLVRPLALETIVAAAGLQPEELVLEVGPGLGALTERLLATGARLVAVEIDSGFCRHLLRLFGGDPRFRLVAGDVMAGSRRLAPAILEAIAGAGPLGWSVVANLPYSISSPFIAAMAGVDPAPRRAVVMVQREVGEVLRAAPGQPSYTVLSFLAALRFRVRPVLSLGPSAFHPRPRVSSVVLALDLLPPRPFALAPTLALARRLFAGRRKQVGASLARLLAGGGFPGGGSAAVPILEACGIEPTSRVEDLAPERIECVAAAIAAVDAGSGVLAPLGGPGV